ncbi:MAG TPA: hypothetical protein VEZ90_06105 [Blastocatellia bacterium]|nr:hypothetical protein [Blastocatellia bacterium]
MTAESAAEQTNGMAAKSLRESVVATEPPSVNWKRIRIAVGIGFLAAQAAQLAIRPHALQPGAILETGSFVGVGIAAVWLAYKSALTFGAGQIAKRAWIFIALMPLSDALTYLAYTMPAYTPSHFRSIAFVGASTAGLSVTRILAAVAFFSMVRVYRRTGVKLELRAQHFVAMLGVTVLEVLTLLYAGSGALALSGGRSVANLVLITSIPMVFALVPCSILGVIVWCYSAQMGGGLVAKAWRSTLLYGVAWLAYMAFHAMVAYYLRFSPSRLIVPAAVAFVMYIGADWLLKGAEYLIFLGASYQYEACTASPDFSDEMKAFTAES